MAANRMIQAKVPGDIPDRANEIIEAPGLTVSDVTRIAQDRRIPPELFQPNAETLAAFAEIDRGGRTDGKPQCGGLRSPRPSGGISSRAWCLSTVFLIRADAMTARAF